MSSPVLFPDPDSCQLQVVNRQELVSFHRIRKKVELRKMNEPHLQIFTKAVKSANIFEYSISTGIEDLMTPNPQQGERRN